MGYSLSSGFKPKSLCEDIFILKVGVTRNLCFLHFTLRALLYYLLWILKDVTVVVTLVTLKKRSNICRRFGGEERIELSKKKKIREQEGREKKMMKRNQILERKKVIDN